jgi:hypothetical protein
MKSMSTLTRHRVSVIRHFKLPAIALGLAIVYLVTLHPVTGFLGGAFFFLLGWWFVPSAINVLLAAWVASLFKIHLAWRVVICLAASFLLGMNTLLPALVRPKPEVSSSADIYRVIRLKPGEKVDGGLMTARLANEASYPSAPSVLGVNLAEKEGCGCMWWEAPRGPTSDEQVWAVIHAYLHRTNNIPTTLYIGSGKMALGAVHVDMRFTRSDIPNTVNLLLTIYDGWDVTAVYRQSAIPVATTLPPTSNKDWPGHHFFRNAMSMLVRQNFWVFLLDSHMSGFSTEPLKSFLHRAMVLE